MAEFRRLPTQQELQQMLFMQGLKPQTTAEIVAQNLQPQTVKPIPENVFQKMAGGARTAAEYVNRAGSAADVAKLFPGYTGQSQVSIPTGFNFAPKQDPMGGVIPQGMQTQQVNVGKLLQAIKPADVIGLTGAQQAYSDIGAGKAPNPLDVADVVGLGAAGVAGTKGLLRATKGLPVGMSIQDVSGGLLKPQAPVSPIGFYSAVEQTALNIPRKQGTGQAFLNDIMKGENVKADEIKWMGLDDFLKGKQNVSRQEVQDFIANNRVNVEEIQLGQPKSSEDMRIAVTGDRNSDVQYTQEEWLQQANAFERLAQDAQRMNNPRNADRYFRLSEEANRLAEGINSATGSTAGIAKFGQWQLPGGENYRELLLTMPEKNQIPFGKQAEIDSLTDRIEQAKNEKRREDYFNLVRERASLINEKEVDQFSSSHFPDQKNILAHLRVNDRVDADGKKMLLIEEVQSDWHQAGRDKGYKTKKNLENWYNQNKLESDPPFADLNSEQISIIERNRNAGMGGDVGVPDAPMKDTWYQLALKRAIQHAAENGYDRIGLTTGSRQAERFDLSKQVDELNYKKNPDGTYQLSAQAGGRGNMIGEAIPESKLADYVGKDVAQKIVENKGQDVNFGGSGSVSQPKDIWKGLSGIDLKVGGEGMKKYYDEIYPKFLDKYGKKWGARVGETSIKGTGTGFDYFKDGDMFSVVDVNNNVVAKFKTQQEAAKEADKMNSAGAEPIRYVDITPEMKAGVSKGQPLFQAIPAIGAGGLLGAQEERK